MFWNIYLSLYYEISITLLIRFDFLGAYYIHFLLKWLLLNPTPFPMFFSVWLVLFIYKEWKRVHMNDFITMTTGFVEELELPESKPRVATYESFYNQDGQYSPTNWYYSWFVNSELFYNCIVILWFSMFSLLYYVIIHVTFSPEFVANKNDLHCGGLVVNVWVLSSLHGK